LIQSNLINRLRKGEEPAFKELVLATSSRLMTVARVYADSAEDAQDVLQDAYVICFEKVATFSGEEPKAFYAWMKKITINLALYKNRKKYKKVETSLDAVGIDRAFDAQILSSLNRKELMELIFSLPDGYRQVFALFAIEGFSHKEIADRLGIKASTSRSQFLRAKKVLQEKIKQLEKFDVA